MRRLFCIGLFLLAAVGCSGENTAARVAELNNSNIKKAANLYVAYQVHFGTSPKDAQAIKEYINSSSGLSPHRLELMQIDPKNLDQIFTSERDHKPFKLKPIVQTAASRSLSPIVFEETGVDGKRQVAFNNSSVQEVDDAKYKEFWEKGAEAVPDTEAADAAAEAKKGS